MATAHLSEFATLYERDETAWLDVMAAVAAEGRLEDLDDPNLGEFLASMAKRDRREVFSRLVVLPTHLLGWNQPPRCQSRSWRSTIGEQRLELGLLPESASLRENAGAIQADAFAASRRRTSEETGLDLASFPNRNPCGLAEILGEGGDAMEGR